MLCYGALANQYTHLLLPDGGWYTQLSAYPRGKISLAFGGKEARVGTK